MTEKESFNAGLSLLAGAVLSTLAMSLHPAGGSMHEIARMKGPLVFSHSIALCSIPMLAFGYRGLSKVLSTGSAWAGLPFSFIQFGLFAVLIAGTINGLLLPGFVTYCQLSTTDHAIAAAILAYGSLFNHVLAYVFIAAVIIATFIWSILISQTTFFPRWLGVFGCGVTAAILIAAALRFNFTTARTFRLLTFLLVSWQTAVAVLLMRITPKNTTT